MPRQNIVKTIAKTLYQQMEMDSSILVLGQDVGKRGGVFLATEGLFDKYGPDRVIDTPLSEAAIIGAAVGMAAYGMRPVAEVQFADYVFPGFDQLVSQAAKIRYRSGGQFFAPMVLRMSAGGGVKGGHHHSQNPESLFVHTPGLKVLYPSTPKDTKGLLTAAIRDDDPVIFMEPKRMYRSVKEEVPEEDFEIEIGKAKIVQAGDDVVLISYGSSMDKVLEATKILREQAISVELIDLRSLMPWDKEAVLKSVARVGRVVLVSEAPRTLNFVSEVSACISEEILDSLLAPPIRVTGFDTPYPYAYDKEYLPSPNRILKAVQKVLDY